MMLGSELLDVTDASRLTVPVRVDREGGRGTRPGFTDGLNTKYFRAAIALLLSRTRYRPGGILYLPPGRYLIENDLPEAWAVNLWDRHLQGTFQRNLGAARDTNPFGASLRFPAELTLWLAPGAVLVPDNDAIVHIESAMVCDPVQVFDLSLGGLIVFGTLVPRLLPQWWGVYPAEDHAPAIQAALDAGTYNRSNRWEYPFDPDVNHPVTWNGVFSKVFPPIPVELRGEYRLHRSIEVRGGARRNRVVEILGDRAVQVNAGVSRLSEEHPIAGIATESLIEGTWNGRAACGARLVADRPFLGETLLYLPKAFGLTVRNIDFEVGESPAPSCLDLVPGVPPEVLQGVAFRGCTFSGGDTTLVRLGPPPTIIAPGNVLEGQPPLAVDSNFHSDISGVAFDECEFRPRSGGIGLMVRTSESVPFRLRNCAFVGVARTMISGWEGTFLLDGCYFENTPLVSPVPVVPGFEEPDGADVYLSFEPPWQGHTLPDGRPAPYLTTPLPGFTATGCVSRSPRFLSTPSPTPRILQRLEWPILLLNVRHLPAVPSDDGIAVQWGMTNHTSGSLMAVGERPSSRLFRGAALVILGGQYRGSLRVLPGAVQSVVVGARSVDLSVNSGLMPIDVTTPRMGYRRSYLYTDVFGLDADPRR